MKTNINKNQKTIVEKNSEYKQTKKEAFSYSVYNKNNFKNFCELKEDKSAKIIISKDLPPEFDEELCNFLNLFRRKTINDKTEWEFYIDYENKEIIHCLHGQSTSVKDWIHSGLMENKKILTIHNHIKGTYSAPSWKNFEILDHEFENYEIIFAEKEYWILEAKGKYNQKYVEKFKTKIEAIYLDTLSKSLERNSLHKKYNPDEDYSNRLQETINKQKNNIKLTKKEYR